MSITRASVRSRRPPVSGRRAGGRAPSSTGAPCPGAWSRVSCACWSAPTRPAGGRARWKATMKSRVATSLTFQSEATIDCEPAWLKAAASVTSAAPGTCSPSAVSHPERIASEFGGRDSPAISRWSAAGSPDRRRPGGGRTARAAPGRARRGWRGGAPRTSPPARRSAASSRPAPSSAVTPGRTRASSRTSRLAAGSVPSGFARARSGESGAAPERAQEVDQLELRHVAHAGASRRGSAGAVRLLPGERVDRKVEEEVVREEDQVLVGAELRLDGAEEVAGELVGERP